MNNQAPREERPILSSARRLLELHGVLLVGRLRPNQLLDDRYLLIKRHISVTRRLNVANVRFRNLILELVQLQDTMIELARDYNQGHLSILEG